MIAAKMFIDQRQMRKKCFKSNSSVRTIPNMRPNHFRFILHQTNYRKNNTMWYGKHAAQLFLHYDEKIGAFFD